MNTVNSNQTIYLELPATSSNHPTKLLAGLGKATKRGIKKCYKCGVYNGSRGMACKNIECDAIFRECIDNKHQTSLEAVKLLITGGCRQLYSVRVRDRGPADHRGFVQLPLMHAHSNEQNLALCFVDSCQRLFDDTILKCHEIVDENQESRAVAVLCAHIDSALRSQNVAVAVAQFSKHVLDALRTSGEIKGKLWSLVAENKGPVVQRVSKTVMAIQCQVSPKHPLGYLHFTFSSNKGKEVYDKYWCNCSELIESVRDKTNNIRLKCMHYYACICALASDTRYSQEFTHFIQFELPSKSYIIFPPFTEETTSCNNRKSIEITKKSNNSPELVVDRSLTDFRRRNNIEGKQPKIRQKKPGKIHHKKGYLSRLAPKTYPVHIKVLNEQDNIIMPEIIETNKEIAWKFIDWLAFVTDSINQTMQFENCGILNSLVFHIPEYFYYEFRKRIPSIYTANDNINNLSCISPPFGQLFYIMNILHLKEIFDTPMIKLRISKRVKHDKLKGYVEYNENEDTSDSSFQSNFIFFLNVGQSTVDESDNTNNSFIIEWITNITNVTKIGQLKFQYKYGRKST